MEESIADPSRISACRALAARLAMTLAVALTLGFAVLTATPAAAAPSAAPPAGERNPDKLYIDADQLVYDKDHDIVTASGGVVLYYKNRVLQADKVVYNRGTKRVLAEGHAKLTDERGDIAYSPRFDLTEDFSSGFADSVQELGADRTRFTSTRIERSAGSVTVLEQGVYTACEPCKAHPESRPIWQVRAAKIVENQETHTVYFENAWIDAFGVPVAYLPFFSAPDPSVSRKSGLLTPIYTSHSGLGVGVGVPYYFAPAPNYDLTLTPTYYSRQGVNADVLWRHRVENGEYGIRVSGINQMDPGAFLAAPFGAGNDKFRYSVETEGKFYLNDKWTTGWNLTFLSDRFYLNDYRLTAFDPSQYFFQDVVSSLYLRGQDGRGFFDLSGYRFQTTTAFLDQRQDPIAAPVFDYHRTFAVDPDKTKGLGGEVTVELNTTNVTRQEALYQATGAQQYDKQYNLYSICAPSVANPALIDRAACTLRGIAGDYARATGQVSWQRKFVDPIGEEWTPFVFARVSGEATELDTSSSVFYGSTDIANSNQSQFFGGATSGSAATGMGGVGLEYRFPFMASTSWGTQVIEPIAQLIVRPNEVLPRLQPNEDAQSLVFDTTNLFAWNKFSGFDRVEGGTRMNYGLQYTANLENGGHAQIVGGQSIQVAGQNSYQMPDAANTGLDSGLDKTYSDFVFGETIQPLAVPISFMSKQQIDSTSGALKRFDSIVNAKAGAFSLSLDYARYAPQPELGWPYGREGVFANASYKIFDTVSVNGGVLFDMTRREYDMTGENTSRFYPANFNLGLAYETSCTTFKVAYASTNGDPLWNGAGYQPPATRTQSLFFQLTLRTLGDIRASTGSSSTQ